MNILTYVEQARSCAIYPDSARFFYPVLGLAGEVGESIDKLIPNIPHGQISTKDDVTKELGDILWYFANTALDAGIAVNDIVLDLTGDIRADTFGELRDTLKNQSDRRSYVTRFPTHVGRIAEIAKKALRDNLGEVPDGKLPVIRESLGNILVCIIEAARHWDIDIDDVAQTNIDKLFSRKERGTLQGSGDNR